MTKILLNYDDELHKKLWNEKELLSILWNKNITWEEFFVVNCLGLWKKELRK